MEIKRIFVFENNHRVFITKNKYSKNRKDYQVGYPVCVWHLTNRNVYRWVAQEHLGVLRSLNTEKKKRFATALSRIHGCKIVYLNGNRPYFIQNDFVLCMPFRKGDL